MNGSAQRAVFPFFVGCPRSGTTLLRALFDSHSQLAIPGESHFVLRLARRRERYERPDGFVAEAFLRDVFADEQFERWHLPHGLVREAVADGNVTSFADAIRALYGAYAVSRGKPLHGDKTPGFVRSLPLLADLFPEAKFIHIVRDGRDVVLSLRELSWAQRGGIDVLAAFWRTNIERAFEVRDDLGPGRYREIRYEALVEDPETALRQLCAFLGLAYEPAMFSYHERADELATSLRRSGDHTRLRLPPTQRLRDWRTELSTVDLEQFELVAGEALERAGYPRAL